MRCCLLVLALLVSSAASAAHVVVADFQSELGCAADHDATCERTAMSLRPHDGMHGVTLEVPAGTWSFRLALDGGAGGYVGRNAAVGGPAIPITLDTKRTVTFLFDPQTRWLASHATDVIATAVGTFQSELGCPADWAPDCLRSWLRDPDGDGVHTFSTRAIPAGAWQVKVAHAQSWAETYGAGGQAGGENIDFQVPQSGREVAFRYDKRTHLLRITVSDAAAVDITRARAHWLTPELIAWDVGALPENTQFRLHFASEGGIRADATGILAPQTEPLTREALPQSLRERHPHLASFAALRLPADIASLAREKLRGQLVVSAVDGDGTVLRATSLQVGPVLDALFGYQGPLGATFGGDGVPTLRVWAPTARKVTARLYAGASTASFDRHVMTLDAQTGVWTVVGEPDWKNRFYTYEVELYWRQQDAVVENVVTDPYGLSTSTNGTRTQIVDLADPALAPPGWASLQKPSLEALEDTVLYELHVRDFSIGDTTVPEPHRGTYLGFTHPGTAGMTHLARLAQAGVTHVHLLPVFDFATIEEDRRLHQVPAVDLGALPPDSPRQQEAIASVAAKDGYNWGYDPLHYTVPEGSYATDPEGAARVLEFRRMVQGLAGIGLRTVMDVVYNHTHAAGRKPGSVLDQIVPGYYQRLNADGFVETSTCCANTASERAMMDKLIVDSVVTWAKAYKVDGFRFDLMGHHPKENLIRVRDALRALTLERDGVDGSKIILYGEGWDFGEVANGARFENASQQRMAGTGIGTFNDRLRDAVRGGTPFNGLQDQGFATGIVSAHNGLTPGTATERRQKAELLSQVVQIGLAGNLASFELTTNGRRVVGEDLEFNGFKVGYTRSPLEAITYVSAHDNETLFDAVQLKAPRTLAMDERVRMHNLATSLVALGQGTPFFHAGDELLRSKSLDRNSYDSGDWFNRIDWTGQGHAWGAGLPPEQDNGAHWEQMGPLLADPALRPSPAHMRRAADHFEELLRIRKSSRLFRSATAEQVKARVQFESLGPESIGMWLREGDEWLFVVFHAGAEPLEVDVHPAQTFSAHPVQLASTDVRLREAAAAVTTGPITVPARTTMVFQVTGPRASADGGGGGMPPSGEGCGCATASGALGALALLSAVALGRRRRRSVSQL